MELAELVKAQGMVNGLGSFASRFGVYVDADLAAGLIKAAFTELTDTEALAAAWVKVVDVINVPLYEEWKEDTKVAIENIKNRVKYTRLDQHGPKLGEITKGSVM